MKNFLQFIIPILVIAVIGFIMMQSSSAASGNKKLYIKCNNSSKSYKIDSITEIDFQPKDEACHLKVELLNVSREYINISTPYLWRLDYNGEIDEVEGLRDAHIVEERDELVLYTMDKQTKFTFRYK